MVNNLFNKRIFKALESITIKINVFSLLAFFIFFPTVCMGTPFEWDKFNYPVERYKQNDAIQIAENILLLQRKTGGWGKLLSPTKEPTLRQLFSEETYYYTFDKSDVAPYSHKSSTIDNGATHSHLRYLLRAAKATNNERYKQAAIKAVEYLLKAQTTTGGWPQNYPNTSSYGGNVTFNDDAMVGVMWAMREVASGEYGFIDSTVKADANLAFIRGVDFIVNSQIVIDGIKTAWCAQHDRLSFMPAGGRIYELPSVSGAESVGIVKLLMSIETPSDAVKEAVISAIEWFENVKIHNRELIKVTSPEYKKTMTLYIKEDPSATSASKKVFTGPGYDYKFVKNNNAKPIWARFYDLETQKPFFVGWDGIKKADISDIDLERRLGYKWYGYWPENLIKYDWPKWKKKHNI